MRNVQSKSCATPPPCVDFQILREKRPFLTAVVILVITAVRVGLPLEEHRGAYHSGSLGCCHVLCPLSLPDLQYIHLQELLDNHLLCIVTPGLQRLLDTDVLACTLKVLIGNPLGDEH
jgi:hypothetical protein